MYLKTCHLGIRLSGNPLSKNSPIWECKFDPRDLQNIHVCEFRLEFLSYLKKKKKNVLENMPLPIGISAKM